MRSGLLRSCIRGALALALVAAPAAAHFLWIELKPGGPRVVRLNFGEVPEEPTEASLLARLAAARVRGSSGEILTLAAGDGALFGSLADARFVAAVQDWGLVDRSGDGSGAFLLEYYAKGASSLQDAAGDAGLPLEVFAREEGRSVRLSVRRGGVGVARSAVHVTQPTGATLDLTADENGEVVFEPAGSGLCGVRARWVEDRKGEHQGKAFGEVRHYSTLTFPASGPLPAAAPLAAAKDADAPAEASAGAPTSADPKAYELLKHAHDSRQVMPVDYPGFRCTLTYQEGDAVYSGQLVYRRQGGTDVILEGLDEASVKWVRDQVQNQVGHRRGGDFAQGDGRHPLQLGPDDGSPYGRLIVVNDEMQSSYRVRDDRVLEVTRTDGGSRFTINVIQTMDADDGKYLANHFLVSYRDEKSGALQKVDGYRDNYAHVDGVWLPVSRTVIEVSDAPAPVVRTIRYRNPQRLAETAETPAGEDTPGG